MATMLYCFVGTTIPASCEWRQICNLVPRRRHLMRILHSVMAIGFTCTAMVAAAQSNSTKSRTQGNQGGTAKSPGTVTVVGCLQNEPAGTATSSPGAVPAPGGTSFIL